MPHITDSSSQQPTINASSSTAVQNSSGVSNSTESVTPTSSLASMIKVGYARQTTQKTSLARTHKKIFFFCFAFIQKKMNENKIRSKISKILLSFFLFFFFLSISFLLSAVAWHEL
jgi:hypothetical protein